MSDLLSFDSKHVYQEKEIQMTDNKRLSSQLAFALEIDKEKNIFRQTHLSGHGRNENDAEHAWHMAIMAYLLREYANEEVDIGRVMLMCLIHDIVEIDAGDTYAYDEEGLATQKEREDAAKERIFSLLPDDQKQELIALFDEFENSETPESRYAHAMDNLQPLILNDSNQGSDWLEHKVCAEQIYGRQGKTRMGSEILYDYTDQVIQKHIGQGHIAVNGGAYSGRQTEDNYKLNENNCSQDGNDCRDNQVIAINSGSTKEGIKISDPGKGKLNNTGSAMEELQQTVAHLRAPDGCPWDRVQTHQSLKAACVEESAEVVSGINILEKTGNPQSLKEELGDLLLQVVMHAQIAEEEGLFTMEDVIRGINEKMIRRHPHVFGEESLKYLPEEYIKSLQNQSGACESINGSLQSPSGACQSLNDSSPANTRENKSGRLSGPQKSLNGIIIDWKQIKSFEKQGREWEEEYLFEAFEEAEELISVARKRKLEKKN